RSPARVGRCGRSAHNVWYDGVLATRTARTPMSAPSLGRLLISHITLRGPELQQLYAQIAARPGISYPELAAAAVPASAARDPFDLGEAPLAEALNFLLV